MSTTKQNSAVYVSESKPNSYSSGHGRIDRVPSLENNNEENTSLDINSYARIMAQHTLRQMERARRMSLRSRRSADNNGVAALGTEASIESTGSSTWRDWICTSSNLHWLPHNLSSPGDDIVIEPLQDTAAHEGDGYILRTWEKNLWDWELRLS